LLKKKLKQKKNLQYFFYQYSPSIILMATKQKSTKMTAADYARIKQEIDAASFKYMLKYGI
jgi:hypothetical protein